MKMTEFNKQELFNKAFLGMKSQGFAPSMSGGSCTYRSLKGMKCAIGHLIDDEDYEESIEGATALNVVVLKSLFTNDAYDSLNDEDKAFIYDIQLCHDNEHTTTLDDAPIKIKERFFTFAEQYDLTVLE